MPEMRPASTRYANSSNSVFFPIVISMDFALAAATAPVRRDTARAAKDSTLGQHSKRSIAGPCFAGQKVSTTSYIPSSNRASARAFSKYGEAVGLRRIA